MKTVKMTWTPSTSEGVDSQEAQILDATTNEPLAGSALSPSASEFLAQVPEGRTVYGQVTTNRQDQSVDAVSDPIDVGWGALLPATSVGLTVLEPGPLRT